MKKEVTKKNTSQPWRIRLILILVVIGCIITLPWAIYINLPYFYEESTLEEIRFYHGSDPVRFYEENENNTVLPLYLTFESCGIDFIDETTKKDSSFYLDFKDKNWHELYNNSEGGNEINGDLGYMVGGIATNTTHFNLNNLTKGIPHYVIKFPFSISILGRPHKWIIPDNFPITTPSEEIEVNKMPTSIYNKKFACIQFDEEPTSKMFVMKCNKFFKRTSYETLEANYLFEDEFYVDTLENFRLFSNYPDKLSIRVVINQSFDIEDQENFQITVDPKYDDRWWVSKELAPGDIFSLTVVDRVRQTEKIVITSIATVLFLAIIVGLFRSYLWSNIDSFFKKKKL